MHGTVSLPTWLAILLAALAAWAALDRLLLPGARWVLRRRVNRVLEELNTRLKIRIQPFKLTKREVLIDRLLYDPQVQQAAEAYAREGDMPRELAMRKVRAYAREIVPAFNAYAYFRFGYWLARNVARSLYRVRLGYSDEEGLAAIPPEATVVFLINHRSNMDYILVAYLAAEKAALSYAVGEWARIWPLQTLVRAMGAYFVRRNSKDPLYRKVLERYVAMATAAGVTQAVFPEGGLSRDGRLRPPKLGILDYMLRSFDPQGARDVVFVPVGINYDRTFEDRTFLVDRDASAKTGAIVNTGRFVGRNLWLKARNEWYRFGYACVNFGSPLSLREYVARRGRRFPGAAARGALPAARRARARADGIGRPRDPGRAGPARRDGVRARARARMERARAEGRRPAPDRAARGPRRPRLRAARRPGLRDRRGAADADAAAARRGHGGALPGAAGGAAAAAATTRTRSRTSSRDALVISVSPIRRRSPWPLA